MDKIYDYLKNHTESIKKNLTSLLFFVVLLVMLFLGDGKQSYVDVLAYGGILAISFIELLWRKRAITGQGKESHLWVTVLTYLLIRTLFSDTISYSIPSFLRFVLAYVIYTLFSNLRIPVRLYSAAILVYTTIAMALSAVVSLSPVLERWLPNMNLLYKVYGHNALSYLLLLSFPIATRQFLKKPSGGLACLVTIFLLGSIATLARTVWFLLAIYIFYVIVTTKISIKMKKLAWFTLSFLTSCIIVFSLPIPLPGFRSLEQTISQKGTVWESRGKYWKQALLSVKEHAIFGTGPGTFYLQSLKYHGTQDSTSLFAHSYPLQVLSELGIIGALILFLLYKKIFVCIFLNKAGQAENHGLIESVILSVILSVVSINFDFLILWMLLWSTLGVLAGQTKQDEQSVPSFGKQLYSIGLAVLIIPYFFLVGSEIFQITIGKERDMFTPYDTEEIIKYIEKRPKTFSYDQAQQVLVFNKEQPDVLSAIGTAFYETDKPYSASLYKRALLNDPLNSIHFIGLMNILAQNTTLVSQVNPIALSDAFFYQAKKDRSTESLAKRFEENRHNLVYKTSFETALQQVLPYRGSYFFPKFYYLMATKLEQKDPMAAKELLRLSIDLAPSWSYFYLELAALHNKEGDKKRANEILGQCQKRKYAQEHCFAYTTETLEPFGNFQNIILQEL